MPEAPDLEAIRGYLNRTVLGREIVCAEIRVPIVARFSKDDFSNVLSGNRMEVVDRTGKFLLFRFADGSVRVRDREEFKRIQEAWAMPVDVAAQAEETCERVRELVARGAEPFGSVGHAWLTRFLAEASAPPP